MPSSYLFLNGLRFHYLDYGGSGTPLVLLHGLSSNAHIWDLVAPQLAQNFRVVALDQRNHGLTDPADEGWDFTSIGRDLQAFVDTLNLEKPIIVGHSWGANTVLQYAAKRPRPPLGIVLVDGGLSEIRSKPEMTWAKAEEMLRPPEMDGMPREEFADRLRKWTRDWPASEDAVNILLANFGIDEDDKIYRRLPVPKHMEIARAIYEQASSELYPRLRCPALLCPALPPTPHDERTAQYIADKQKGADLALQNPLVRVQWFEDTYHDIPLHKPDALAHAITQFGLSL